MTTDEPLSYGELESAAGTIIGRIVFSFSRFEFNLGLCIRNAVGGSDVEAINPLLHRLSFKAKLDALIEIVEHKYSSNVACVAEFKQWYKGIDAIRAKRNSFVHGRWGIHGYAQQVVNVAPGMPNEVPQREIAFTLHELQQELVEVDRVIGEFEELRTRWRL